MSLSMLTQTRACHPWLIAIAVEYDGKPYEIKGTVKYQLNPAYDAKP